MKKLFASLMAATMVAGMSVSAFAYTDVKGDTKVEKGGTAVAVDADFEDDNDYALGNPSKAVKSTVFGGKSIYIPILVDVREVEDDDEMLDGYFYATKASEVSGVKASVKETQGKGSIKSVQVVREYGEDVLGHKINNLDEDKRDLANSPDKKIYAIKIKMNDYFATEEKDLEFDLTLKDGSKEMVKVEDTFYYKLGSDDENPAKKVSGEESRLKALGGYDAKFKKSSQLLELTVGKDTKAVTLDEVDRAKFDLKPEDKNEIKEIYMETADGEMIVEGKLSEQDPLFLKFTTEATDFQKAVMVENNDADVDTFVWSAHPTFDFAMDVRVPVEDDRDNFLYEVIDGKLVEVDTELSEDGDELTFKTKTLGEYILSDKQLTAEKAEAAAAEKGEAKEEAKEDGKKENSETGAAIAVATVIALF